MLARLALPSLRSVRALGARADALAKIRTGGVWPTQIPLERNVSFALDELQKHFGTSCAPQPKERLVDDKGVPDMHPGMKRSLLGAQNVGHAPIYDSASLDIQPKHRSAQSVKDRVAYALVQVMRGSFDIVSGYNKNRVMTEAHWLRRVMFLETVAGVPGMVAGMLRHLRSLRSMERDRGWITTLMEEAENERMHLMTFLEVRKAGPIMRGLVIVGQGVMFNLFFVAYTIAPKLCHRWVGYLEEEAVKTYTHLLHDIDTEGTEVSNWSTIPAPELAINYWQLESNATLRDVVLVVRADEACHSHVNHTFGSMELDDTNPFRPECHGPGGHEPPHSMDILKDVPDDFTKVSPKFQQRS